MSHSQFHYLKLILRHAWLNHWDKHMTTGRINQVRIVFLTELLLRRRHIAATQTKQFGQKLRKQLLSSIPLIISLGKQFAQGLT